MKLQVNHTSVKSNCPPQTVQMVKQCAWGTCNSDTRFLSGWATVCIFLPFPKPHLNCDKCLLWTKLCGS